MYKDLIRNRLAATGHIGKYDPRHIEAYMRLEHSTLDGLSREQFGREVEWARQAIDLSVSDAERLAKSFGL